MRCYEMSRLKLMAIWMFTTQTHAVSWRYRPAVCILIGGIARFSKYPHIFSSVSPNPPGTSGQGSIAAYISS